MEHNLANILQLVYDYFGLFVAFVLIGRISPNVTIT